MECVRFLITSERLGMAEISPTRGRLHYLEHARDTIYDFIPNWDSSPSKLAHRLLPSS